MSITDPIEMVSLRDGSRVEVRELPWTKALEFVALLTRHAQEVIDPLAVELAAIEKSRPFPPSLRAKEGTEWDQYLAEMAIWENSRKQVVGRVLIGQIQGIVSSSSELAAFLLKHATNKDEEWLSKLHTGDALRLLESAIGLTLNDEIIQRGKAVAARVMLAFAPAAPSTTTS